MLHLQDSQQENGVDNVIPWMDLDYQLQQSCLQQCLGHDDLGPTLSNVASDVFERGKRTGYSNALSECALLTHSRAPLRIRLATSPNITAFSSADIPTNAATKTTSKSHKLPQSATSSCKNVIFGCPCLFASSFDSAMASASLSTLWILACGKRSATQNDVRGSGPEPTKAMCSGE